MKLLGSVMVLFLAAAGCSYRISPPVGLGPAVPYYHTMTVKVVNGTNFTITVVDDAGRSQRIAPGGWAMYTFWNLGDRSAEVSLAALATDERGRILGTTKRSFFVSGYRRQSETWILRKYDFRG